jgi:hypothetical protein
MENQGMDWFGRHIENGEISIAKAKVDAFAALRSPTSFQEVGKDIGAWAAGLAAPLNKLYHSENEFQRMKQLVGGHEVLVPLRWSASYSSS